ncbi:MAG: regulatory protein RecX [Methylococcales bacterium]
MSDDTSNKIKQICLELLARGELTRQLLADKLAQRGYQSDAVMQVIDELTEQGWQSDQRYTEQYIAMRSRKGFGPVRIQMELQQRGIDETIASHAVSDVLWQDNLANAYRKKYNNSSITNWSDRTKRMRFLQYRGFPSEQIQRFMQTLDQDNEFITDDFG